MAKRPESVLVVIQAADTGQFLLLQRKDNPHFWQSVTGSLEAGEQPADTALREVHEETGIDILGEALQLHDCQRSAIFEIYPTFRHRYLPTVSHNLEHWFYLRLPQQRAVRLTEHDDFKWMSLPQALALVTSWSNSAALQETASLVFKGNV